MRKKARRGIYSGTEVYDLKGHRDVSVGEGGVGEIPALSFGVSELKATVEFGVRASLRNRKPLKALDLKPL